MTHLHIFALNEPITVTHTNLTRQKGDTPDLPPLAAWLGVDTVDTDEIELFAIKELGDMPLSEYIRLAFGPEEEIARADVARLDALSGAVLLVPDAALPSPPRPGPEATLIAFLPLARADNAGSLPKADVTPTPARARDPIKRETPPPIALYALIAMAVLAAVIIFVGWR